MKNDQSGDRPRDPRHVYANPLQPTICPILALAIYWTTFTFDADANRLFPGYVVAAESKRRGVIPRDLGTRKIASQGMCLASLVYHTPFIRTHFPPRHPLFETSLFQDAQLLDNLVSRVKCGFSGPNTHLTATGLPPHVSILGQMKALQDNTMSTIDHRHGIVNDIVYELEQRSIDAGMAGVHDLVSRLNMPVQQAVDQHEVQDEQTVLPTFFWAGSYRRRPQDLVLLDCSPAHLWVLWRFGNTENNLPSLHL
ncbi:hypothetical protein PHMEG_00024660 [Phytophthora megakarya]|uniref:Uncharacterized protein n=1 Tax=Phytophthora megakarya TaxID=4795 RepID=A0A225VDW6_9STRA|nr:hypothetical protein PHMEG_00024660 [Phytophthora megakarya]